MLIFNSIFEIYSKIIIIFGGVIIFVVGWFFWNLVFFVIYECEIGIFIVCDVFFENFGCIFVWWIIVFFEFVVFIVLELVIQVVRRVYWLMDEDFMQRVEKDVEVYKVLKERVKQVDVGEGEGFEMQDLVLVMDGRGEKGKRRMFGFGRKEEVEIGEV